MRPHPLCCILWRSRRASLQSRPHFIVWPFSSRLPKCIISAAIHCVLLCFQQNSGTEESIADREARSTRLRYPSGWPASNNPNVGRRREQQAPTCRQRQLDRPIEMAAYVSNTGNISYICASSWMNLALFRSNAAYRLPSVVPVVPIRSTINAQRSTGAFQFLSKVSR